MNKTYNVKDIYLSRGHTTLSKQRQESFNQIIAHNLRRLRIERKICGKVMAAVAGFSGPGSYYNLEAGWNHITASTVLMISQEFNIPIEEFFKLDESKQ